MGTANLTTEVDNANNLFCASFTFNNNNYDVFGDNINLSTLAGSLFCSGTVTPGVVSGTCISSVSDAFNFSGDFGAICDPPGCLGDVSFISTAISGVSGSVDTTLAPVTYTIDGAATFVGGFPASIIPGCSLTNVARYTGTSGISAFEQIVTDPDNPTVETEAVFFNPITGQEVSIEVDIGFGGVNGAGVTTVTASSNVTGNLTANFAASVGGFQAAFLDIVTTAPYTPPITICTTYEDSAPDNGVVDGTTIPESALTFTHEEAGVFVDRTSSHDTANNIICATVNSLSNFGVVVRTAGLCSMVGNPCDDGNACTLTDVCNGSLQCVGSGAPDCDDGVACTLDSCVAPAGCVHGPRTTCLAATKSQLSWVRKDTDPSKEKLLFKWAGGPGMTPGDFGNPVTGDNYDLCVFANNAMTVRATVNGNTTCDGKPCWSEVPDKGYKFKDKNGGQSGITKIEMKAGDIDKTKVQLKGKGVNLDFLNAPAAQAAPIKAQFGRVGDTLCFEGSYGSDNISKNNGVKFGAKEK